jgi:hypothetical protein
MTDKAFSFHEDPKEKRDEAEHFFLSPQLAHSPSCKLRAVIPGFV